MRIMKINETWKKVKVRVKMEMIIRSLKKCGITISTVMDCSKDSRVNIEGIEYVTLQSEEEFHLDASSDGMARMLTMII